MIRSGEHALWDAHMLRGRVQADRTVMVRLRFDTAKVDAAIREYGLAMRRAMRNAAREFDRFAQAHAAARERNGR